MKEKSRYIYIDLLRGWAVLVMIEVHVVNAFLIKEYRDQSCFEVLNFINGLVAPSFLFIAGYSFVLIAQRKWSDYLSLNSIFWKQVGRILQILVVGYALHLPVFSFNKLLTLSWQEWGVFWKIDVLHAISISLLVLLLLVIIARSDKSHFKLVLGLAAIIIFSSPLMFDRNIDHLFPEPISNYFTAAHRSQFPLFPWMGFVLCGGIAAQLLVWWKQQFEEQKIFSRFFIAGIGLIVFSLVSEIIPFSFYPEHDFWRASPEFFFIRLGIVLIILAGLWLWEKRKESGRSLVSIVGSESLLAYAGHLLIIYGQFFNGHSLAYLIGKNKTIPEVMLMTVGLIAVTVAGSYVWNRIKNWSMFYARILMYSILIIVLYIFLTKPL